MILPKWFKNIFRHIGIRFYNLYQFRKDLKEDVENITPKIKISIKLADKTELDELFRISPPSLKQAYLRYRGICGMAFHKNKLAGYVWLNDEFMPLGNINMGRVPEKSLFLYKNYTFPEFRNKGISKSLISKCYRDAKEKGHKSISCFVNANNLIAVKIHEDFREKKKKIIIITLPFKQVIRIAAK